MMIRAYIQNLRKSRLWSSYSWLSRLWPSHSWHSHLWPRHSWPSHKRSPILPRGTIGGLAPGMVTSVMCFLACLALGMSLIIGAASERWLTQAGRAVTVQIIDHPTQSATEQLPAVLGVLERHPAIAKAEILPQQVVIDLLEPWLGAGHVTDDLPLPILIDITLNEEIPLQIRPLTIELKALAPGAMLDTHGHWRQTLERSAQTLRLLAALVLLLVLIATGTVLVFVTRAALAGNHDIIDVLHVIGAHDRFISRQFEKNLFFLSAFACLAGYSAALAVFAVIINWLPDMIGTLFYLQLFIVPFIIVMSGWLITRHYVMHILKTTY